MNGFYEFSNIYDLQLLCSTNGVEWQFEVKLSIYLGVGVTILCTASYLILNNFTSVGAFNTINVYHNGSLN